MIGERLKRWLDVSIVAVAAVGVVLAAVVATAPVCGNGVVEGRLPDPRIEECDDGNTVNGDGCSSSCLVEFPTRIYVAHYLGNIDGGFSEEWYYFLGVLNQNFLEKQVPVGATVYPASIAEDSAFAPYIMGFYDNPYVELVQKGDTGLGEEQKMDALGYDEQRSIIEAGREDYVRNMAQILGISEDEVVIPKAYNQPQGRFTDTTRQVLEDLNFTIFFEMYMNDDLYPVNSTEELDVLQYGVGFTRAGDAGKDSEFFSPGEFLLQLRNFNRVDLNMLYINGSRVVPIWVHQQDFERKDKADAMDYEKWATYNYIIDRLRQEPNIVFVSPQDIWEMRHPGEEPPGIILPES
jgi:cysteine-rich repeat protein